MDGFIATVGHTLIVASSKVSSLRSWGERPRQCGKIYVNSWLRRRVGRMVFHKLFDNSAVQRGEMHYLLFRLWSAIHLLFFFHVYYLDIIVSFTGFLSSYFFPPKTNGLQINSIYQ